MNLVSIGEFARMSRLSPKALRLYDELGLLAPARVDESSGYRWYDPAQLSRARLVAALRRIGVPLAEIGVLVDLDAPAAAERLRAYWADVESDHAGRRELADYLIDRLNGKRSTMSDIQVRSMPERTLLYLERHANSHDEVWALGKEFIGIIKGTDVPRLEGRTGAAFLLYLGEVNEDSDGPVAFCLPVPDDAVERVAAEFPQLSVRTEPAHDEAFISLGDQDPSGAAWQLIAETAQAWAEDHLRDPSALGVRLTMLPAPGGLTVDRDFAVPLADVD